MAVKSKFYAARGAWIHWCDTEAERPSADIKAGDMAYCADTNKWWNAASATTWLERGYASAGGGGGDISGAWPVGSVFTSLVATNPASLLGFGTWQAFGAGRVLVGIDAGQTEFDTVRETGGAKTHTLTTSEMPVHTHVQDAHTHVQNAHTHVQDAHTHVQNAHSHVIRSQTATTGTATSYEHGTLDTSSTENEATEVTDAATAVNQNATAVNQNATAVNQNATAVNQNAGGGAAHSVMNPYVVVYFWERVS